MARPRRCAKLKAWLSRFLTRDKVLSVQNMQNIHAANDIAIAGDGNVVTVISANFQVERHHADSEVTSKIMLIFSERIIPGISYRGHIRGSSPHCHPNTRVNIITRIKSWFDGQGPGELLLWITGPAGVGKSAIVWTLAQYLAKKNSLGAALFFSKPTGRNDPHLVFITIAYHLSTQIAAYRDFLIDRLALDPDLLNMRMEEQFTTFIVEPFQEKKFEAGGKRWAILLDGLDELEGKDAQRKIIQLISTFAHEYRNAPLIWIMSSRSEPHIANRFGDDDVRQACWSETIPIDSEESCEDVKRFLRSSFKETEEKYRHSLIPNWPGEEAITKIAAAASGLFIYAELVMQSIRNPAGNNPDEQLRILLSGIDQSTQSSNPLVHLDEFYSKIFSVNSWPTKKKLLCFAIQWKTHSVFIPEGFNTLRGMSIFFGLTRGAIYGCLEECHSTLKIPTWEVAHQENLAFLHESFPEYLMDSTRSQGFYIHTGDTKDDMKLRLFEMWDECSADNVAIVSVESAWHQYCTKSDRTLTPAIKTFHAKLYRDLVHCLKQLVIDSLTEPGVPVIQAQLHKINFNKLCYYLNPQDFWEFALGLLACYSNKLSEGGLVREVHLGDLSFEHLDCEDMSPAHAHVKGDGTTLTYKLRRPPSSDELRQFVSELENTRKLSPEIHAFVYGSAPGQVTIFRCPLQKDPCPTTLVIPS